MTSSKAFCAAAKDLPDLRPPQARMTLWRKSVTSGKACSEIPTVLTLGSWPVHCPRRQSQVEAQPPVKSWASLSQTPPKGWVRTPASVPSLTSNRIARSM